MTFEEWLKNAKHIRDISPKAEAWLKTGWEARDHEMNMIKSELNLADGLLNVSSTESDLRAAEELALQKAGDWFLNWLVGAGVKVEESNIRQGVAFLLAPDKLSLLAAHDTSLLREKEMAVVRHVMSGWYDGCQCEPCIAVRGIVSAHDTEIAVITRRNVVDDIETGCMDLATPPEIREALRVHDAEIVGKSLRYTDDQMMLIQNNWNLIASKFVGDEKLWPTIEALAQVIFRSGYVDPAKREEAAQ